MTTFILSVFLISCFVSTIYYKRKAKKKEEENKMLLTYLHDAEHDNKTYISHIKNLVIGTSSAKAWTMGMYIKLFNEEKE